MNSILVILAAAVTIIGASAAPPQAGDDNDIVVISARASEKEVTARTIERIYLKRKLLWEDKTRVVPLNLPPDHPLRAAFTEKVLKREHRALVEYWNQQYFRGKKPPLVVESEEAVKRFVKEVPGAVGYISKKNLEPDLVVLYVIAVE
ncbi:MAG: hypothetical protein V3W31_09795 [Thermodesulfobacteriota bacterium]